jgi:hypothetical protein
MVLMYPSLVALLKSKKGIFCKAVQELPACTRLRFLTFGIGFDLALAPSIPFNITYPADILTLMKYSEPARANFVEFSEPIDFAYRDPLFGPLHLLSVDPAFIELNDYLSHTLDSSGYTRLSGFMEDYA